VITRIITIIKNREYIITSPCGKINKKIPRKLTKKTIGK